MEKFKAGNVVRLASSDDGRKGSIVIIVGYRTVDLEYSDNYKVVDWISFSHSNSSGCTRVDTYTEESMCWDCGINDGGSPEDCENCNDTGHYEATINGMGKAEVLADNVKSFIISNLTKNFDF